MLEFDTICGEGKNYTGNINMKTLMKTAMKTIMKSSLCALAAVVLSSTAAFATALDTTLAGIYAHLSALKGGETLKIPQV